MLLPVVAELSSFKELGGPARDGARLVTFPSGPADCMQTPQYAYQFKALADARRLRT